MFRLKYFILGLSIICVGFNVLLYAQEEIKPYASKEECIKKFDIDNINFLDPIFLEKTKLKVSLWRYFLCRAALNNDISECDKLDPDGSQTCRKNFNATQGFFEKLLLYRSNQQLPSREIIDVCVSEMNFGVKTCKQYIEAFTKQDTSICKNPPFVKDKGNCEAFISLNETLTTDQETKDMVHYIKAMRDLEAGECSKIQYPYQRIECQAYVTGDKSICEQVDEFKKFREAYCTEVSQPDEGGVER